MLSPAPETLLFHLLCSLHSKILKKIHRSWLVSFYSHPIIINTEVNRTIESSKDVKSFSVNQMQSFYL